MVRFLIPGERELLDYIDLYRLSAVNLDFDTSRGDLGSFSIEDLEEKAKALYSIDYYLAQVAQKYTLLTGEELPEESFETIGLIEDSYRRVHDEIRERLILEDLD
jgi:hypothetical protein